MLHTRHSVRGPSFIGEPVVGVRRGRGVALLYQGDGTLVCVLDRADPSVGEMLRNGSVEVGFRPPRRDLWRTALLKHAYLAACVYLQVIPVSPHANFVRDELLDARDAGVGHRIGLFADSLRMLRGYNDPPTPLYLAAAEVDGQRLAMIGLGHYGLVSWPFADLKGALVRRLGMRCRGVRYSGTG